MKAYNLGNQLKGTLRQTYAHETTNVTEGPSWVWTPGKRNLRALDAHNLLLVWSFVHNHDQLNGMVMSVFDDGDNGSWMEPQGSIVFFSDDMYESFSKWEKTLGDDWLLFKTPQYLDNPLYTVFLTVNDNESSLLLSNWDQSQNTLRVNLLDLELYKWLYVNCQQEFYRLGRYFWFVNKDDAVMFKLCDFFGGNRHD